MLRLPTHGNRLKLIRERINTTPDLKVESASLWARGLKNDFGATNYSRMVERRRAMVPSKNPKSTTLHLRGLLDPTLQTWSSKKNLFVNQVHKDVCVSSVTGKIMKEKPILWVSDLVIRLVPKGDYVENYCVQADPSEICFSWLDLRFSFKDSTLVLGDSIEMK